MRKRENARMQMERDEYQTINSECDRVSEGDVIRRFSIHFGWLWARRIELVGTPWCCFLRLVGGVVRCFLFRETPHRRRFRKYRPDGGIRMVLILGDSGGD